jgi:hypothetical protein
MPTLDEITKDEGVGWYVNPRIRIVGIPFIITDPPLTPAQQAEAGQEILALLERDLNGNVTTSN